MIRDLELILYHFSQVLEKLQIGYVKNKDNNQLLTSAHENNQKFDIENFDSSQSMLLGNLLPLGCGHNGCFSKKETLIYEYHLRCAGFI